MQDTHNGPGYFLSDAEYHRLALQAIQAQRDELVWKYGEDKIQADPVLRLQYQEFESLIEQHADSVATPRGQSGSSATLSSEIDNRLVFGRF
ncbi:MAG: hypothetical protein ACKKL5_01215 [Candidatus Komeilibacteria bacterium]